MPLLRAEGVSVRFGGLLAVAEASLSADAGSVTGLIGPNGAGKTTLFNVITGLQRPTEGRVFFEDQDLGDLKPHERARLGLARTFQRLEVFGSLTARDNVLVAAEIRGAWGTLDHPPAAVADEVVERVGLSGVADERVDALPTGLARLVELGRALATQPRAILLDEPSSGLGEGGETDFFAELLVSLAAGGLAILLVEHDVELVMRVCSRIHVLDFGRMIAVGTPEEIRASEAVRAAYLGAGEGEVA